LTLAVLTLVAAGCYRPRPATVPLRTLAFDPGTPEAHCLVVFLPGRGDVPEDGECLALREDVWVTLLPAMATPCVAARGPGVS